MTDLNKALRAITLAQGVIPLVCPAGPNDWDSVSCKDFGPEHDYTVERPNDLIVVTPVSNAAMQWCYRHIEEGADRWGVGWVVPAEHFDSLVAAMDRDGLMSQVQYENAMEEMNAQRLADQ